MQDMQHMEAKSKTKCKHKRKFHVQNAFEWQTKLNEYENLQCDFGANGKSIKLYISFVVDKTRLLVIRIVR